MWRSCVPSLVLVARLPVRQARLATAAVSSAGSTGLAIWVWKPASKRPFAVLRAGEGGEGGGRDILAVAGLALTSADEIIPVLARACQYR